MHDVTTLKTQLQTNTLHLSLLTVATGGIYPLLWLYKNQSTVFSITGNTFSSASFIIWIAVCTGLSRVLPGLSSPDEYGYNAAGETLTIIAGLLTLGGSVLYIIWAFKARTALQHYALQTFRFELKMNVFYTLVFNVYYVVYCINALPEALAKHTIIYGQTTMPENTSGTDNITKGE